VPTPYLGEIRIFAGEFAPAGWATCDGTELEVAGNEDLYAVLGSAYGGDGDTTFALPDLRGRAPMHRGQGTGTSLYARGDSGGVEGVSLTTQQMPLHTHGFQASRSVGSSPNAAENVVAAGGNIDTYAGSAPTVNMAAAGIAPTGTTDQHENRMPFVAINYVMATGPEATSGDGPFVGEVRPLAGDVVPAGWARCDGQLLPIEQNPVLFSIASTLYGGDGESTFALPDLRGGVVIGSGQGAETSEYFQGTAGGEAAVALVPDDLPAHVHRARGTTAFARVQSPGPDRSLAQISGGVAYQTNATAALTTMSSTALGTAGSSAPHDNYQPVLTLTFVIALEGEIPSR
jgi:microcystin-dependent protein